MGAAPKKKIALVLTGAVSLGSFEAGVAYELVRYIKEQNNPDIEIDVIVGTSAGALTGALTALVLADAADPQILEESWLSVRLEDLLKLKDTDRSILSNKAVEKLVSQYVSPTKTALDRSTRNPVTLVVVVTNLDGIKYSIQRTKDKAFSISAISYEDSLKFQITKDFSDWDTLRNAVMASSAFPVAFSHRQLVREEGEFGKRKVQNFGGRHTMSFNYSDGGIVNNQPLNKAIEIVNELPYLEDERGFERVFLVVDPSPPSDDLIPGSKYTVFDVAGKALWTIPRNQTLYKDILLLEKVNRRVHWKNAMISAMADLWNSSKTTEAQKHEFDRLCNEIAMFKGKTILGIDPAEYIEVEKKRLFNDYREQAGKATDPDAFIKYCFLLEQVADLRNKHEVSVEMIRPQNADKELAGVIFGSFGGFMDSGLMKHDYNVGRSYAKRWLKTEMDLHRMIHLRKEELSPKVQKQVLQKMLDNTVPLLVEDIGPKLLSSKGLPEGEGPGVKLFALTAMVSKSLVKYIFRKGVTWAKTVLNLR